MAVIDFPEVLTSVVEQEWGQVRDETENRSIFGKQVIEASVPMWKCSITYPQDYEKYAGEWQTMLILLEGKINQLELHNLGRPIPAGTLDSGVVATLDANATQGDISVDIYVGTAYENTTLLAGDYFGIGANYSQQVVMITEDCTVNSSGIISPVFTPPLRNSFLIGEEIRFNKPKVLFRRTDSEMSWDYESVFVNGTTIDLIEDYTS